MQLYRAWLPKAVLVAAAVIVTGVGGALIAQTARADRIPPPDGVIAGCYNLTNGQLRLGENGCRESESAIFWNQLGPQGPAGPQGVPGPQGPGIGMIGGGTLEPLQDIVSFIAPFHPEASVDEIAVAQIMPAAGTLRSLTARASIKPGITCTGTGCDSGSWSLRVYRNGDPTDLFCSIRTGTVFSDPNFNQQIPCFNGTASAQFEAGDLMSIRVERRANGFAGFPDPTPIHWTAVYQ